MKIKDLVKALEKFNPEQEIGVVVPAFDFIGTTFYLKEFRTDDRGYILFRESPHHPDDQMMIGIS